MPGGLPVCARCRIREFIGHRWDTLCLACRTELYPDLRAWECCEATDRYA